MVWSSSSSSKGPEDPSTSEEPGDENGEEECAETLRCIGLLLVVESAVSSAVVEDSHTIVVKSLTAALAVVLAPTSSRSVVVVASRMESDWSSRSCIQLLPRLLLVVSPESRSIRLPSAGSCWCPLASDASDPLVGNGNERCAASVDSGRSMSAAEGEFVEKDNGDVCCCGGGGDVGGDVGGGGGGGGGESCLVNSSLSCISSSSSSPRDCSG